MELEGQLVSIIFHNDINSYTVGEFYTTNNEEVTVVGYLPFINVGDSLKLVGDLVEHPDYGVQLRIKTFEKIIPSTPEALEKYLVNGNFKGVGPATAKKIVDTFGNDTINIIKLEPEKLTQIKGITKEKAFDIAEEFMRTWDMWEIVKFLDRFGIGPQSAENICKKLGDNALKQIEDNPYILVDLANKVDFQKIDNIALEMGYEPDSYKRIRSGIIYGLGRIAINGHSTARYENLLKYACDLLGINEDRVEDTIINMQAKKEIVIEDRIDNTEWVYLKPFYEAEKNIAETIVTLNQFKNIKEIKNIDKEIGIVQEKIGMTLSERQIEAIKSINEDNVCIITGGPGTGKTTIIKAIIELYKKHGMKPVLCAPTGRAAKRITELTGEEAKTLHRLLELAGVISDDTDNYNTDLLVTPIDGDIIIVDETSMVDMFLMNYLLKAIYKGTKLVFVGDIDQLPSVGPGTVLKDLINSKRVKTIVLNQIFRQAAKSQIIVNAHRVNEGKLFIDIDNKEESDEDIEYLDDFYFIREMNKEKVVEKIVDLYLKKAGNNIQLISPTKRGVTGTKELNRIIQLKINPEDPSKKEKKYGDVIFRENDRVMQTKNNYNIIWEKNSNNAFGKELGNGVFNGELGIIEKVNNEEKTLSVRFDDGKLVEYQNADLEQLEHAYALTVHKSQGSEFDVVIIPITQEVAPMLQTRNLLYTAITRAKQMIIIIGNNNIVNYMINNNNTKNRNTGLKYKLENM